MGLHYLLGRIGVILACVLGSGISLGCIPCLGFMLLGCMILKVVFEMCIPYAYFVLKGCMVIYSHAARKWESDNRDVCIFILNTRIY